MLVEAGDIGTFDTACRIKNFIGVIDQLSSRLNIQQNNSNAVTVFFKQRNLVGKIAYSFTL
ncbi:hypothetical protein HMPREF9069_00076 [Atopobium sp. oral taxon 810 str. F0209]|nr:hypothetical protein HMPREF9069_00076 [Atopobium sp. oral taxon 810 str. F0209]